MPNPVQPGEVFGRLTVLSCSPMANRKEGAGYRVELKCSCGETMTLGYSQLIHYRSCGCASAVRKPRNLPAPQPGDTFGRLSVERIDVSDIRFGERSRVVCVCSCGNPVRVALQPARLAAGRHKSCGHCVDYKEAT